ncbi:phosphotransferase family protein [Streptomyces fragilis]|uniref:Phosphotransferase n=1 Tax=Streptomyces fragilis TaxID=67301 RepID=A0ABV2YGP0_9ACTN|nr:phosphotransferase [Streptomyces fragilis]
MGSRPSSTATAPPPAAGVRCSWWDVPRRVRGRVEAALGSPVEGAVTQPGGFSPCVAARVRLADGGRFFVKAVGPDPNPDTPGLHRAEARVTAALPAGGFRALAETAGHAGADPGARLDPWARRHLEQLAAREAGWAAAAAGTALVHGDLRADNILLTADRVVFVDWPWAAIGAPWFDVVAMGPSVVMQSDDPEDAVARLDRHLVGRGADPGDVTTVLVAVAGYFLHSGLQAPPPGLPTLRAFQRAQGEAALRWLRRRQDPW